MTRYARYAIYYAAEQDHPLWQFGNEWMGYNPETGEEVSGVGKDFQLLTQGPQKYGFHGTLKPPFALKDGYSVQDLDTAIYALVDCLQPIRSGPLKLASFGNFFSLVPSERFDGLKELASACVVSLDGFRDEQTAAQLKKRRAAGLNQQQEDYLLRYGYPYVLDAFRFHLTLSGRLDDDQINRLTPTLKELTSPFCKNDFEINQLCLFAEPADGGRFHLIKRYSL